MSEISHSHNIHADTKQRFAYDTCCKLDQCSKGIVVITRGVPIRVLWIDEGIDVLNAVVQSSDQQNA